MKYKPGMKFKSNNSDLKIQLISKRTGNGHWNSKKINSTGKAHMIHEGTLKKYYSMIED